MTMTATTKTTVTTKKSKRGRPSKALLEARARMAHARKFRRMPLPLVKKLTISSHDPELQMAIGKAVIQALADRAAMQEPDQQFKKFFAPPFSLMHALANSPERTVKFDMVRKIR